MKSFSIILTILLVPSFLLAQNCDENRYRQSIFNEVTLHENVVYSTADAYDFLNQDNPEDYHIDIYEPTGDTQAKRPVVFFFFGGGFFEGDKQDADMVTWCDSLARRGYVAVAVNYRLGFNFVDSGSPIRAVYRAVQDANASIRYMIEFKDQYRIDPERIFIAGKSAGAITAMHTTFFGEESDRLQETYGTLLEGSDLGCVSCSGNPYNHTFEIQGVLGMWGAIIDTLEITPDETIPTLMVHGNGDLVVPFEGGYPYTGPVPLTFPYVYGSFSIHNRMNELGIYNEFYSYDYNNHDVYGSSDFPNENWEEIFDISQSFLADRLDFVSPTPQGETQITVGNSYTYSVMPNLDYSYCWAIDGGIIINENEHEVEVQWNEPLGTLYLHVMNDIGMKGQTASLNVNASTNVDNTILSGIEWYPNPVHSGESVFIKNPNNLLSEAVIINTDGRQMLSFDFEEDTTFSTQGLAPGIYLLRITNGLSFRTMKFIVQ